jgi:hypothetical protein
MEEENDLEIQLNIYSMLPYHFSPIKGVVNFLGYQKKKAPRDIDGKV